MSRHTGQVHAARYQRKEGSNEEQKGGVYCDI
ncbi:hypothetical protein SRHO_G00326020 [Serrasalmus rhombeus]